MIYLLTKLTFFYMKYYKFLFKILSISFLLIMLSCNIEPFDGDTTDESTTKLLSSCEEAFLNALETGTQFSSVFPSDNDYSTFCIAYKKALEDQIFVCGDQGGTFQSIIDSIGDCENDDE